MGEADKPKKTALAQACEDAMLADTMGGRIHVRCDESARATPHGEIVSFSQFQATAGVFDRSVQADRTVVQTRGLDPHHRSHPGLASQ